MNMKGKVFQNSLDLAMNCQVFQLLFRESLQEGAELCTSKQLDYFVYSESCSSCHFWGMNYTGKFILCNMLNNNYILIYTLFVGSNL